MSGRTMTLLKCNELDKRKKRKVDLIFQKERSSQGLHWNLIYENNEDIIDIATIMDIYNKAIKEKKK